MLIIDDIITFYIAFISYFNGVQRTKNPGNSLFYSTQIVIDGSHRLSTP